jgi:hypothetical protein
MALSGTRLGDAIWAAVKATTNYTPPDTPTDNKGKAVWEAIANCIVSEITGHAEVEPGTFEAPPGGTYPGGAITGEGEII